MKITIFSGNHPRHLSLVKGLSKICDEVYFISEVKTLFTGLIVDKVPKSNVMGNYFQNVVRAEKKIFGEIGFLPDNVNVIGIKAGDLSNLNAIQLKGALDSDLYLVFSASYIKGWLIDFLIEHGAINVHMGLSPYYRGSSCNFWALYDNNPGYVGATIHLLSRGLDNGNMLFHCVPKPQPTDTAFEFSMRSVLAAQLGLISAIDNKSIYNYVPVVQDRSKEIRYTRNRDFTDTIAQDFLNKNIRLDLDVMSYPDLLDPFIT